MLPLGAGLEALQAMLDAIVDALVVTGLKMQAVIVRLGAPIAAVERIVGPQKYRCGDRLARAHREFDDEAFAQCATDLGKKLPVQIRRVAVPREGQRVVSEHALEQRLVQISAAQRAKLY